ncbi:MAG: lactonase family protein [Thermomicrobiales bacterium]
MTASERAPLIYVGTYTDPAMRGKAEGISVYRLDPSSGALTHVRTIAGVPNPSFLAIDPSRRFLYACNETETYQGRAGGGVSALALDAATGSLTARNTQPTHGTFPAHLTVDPTGAYVLVANYGSGNVAVYPIGSDGDLGAMSDLVQNTGSGPNSARQKGPHAHMITFDLSGRYTLLVDLGIDKTLVYRLDTTTGRLHPHMIVTDRGVTEQSCGQAAPGVGPRHIAFHPTNRYAYVINELGSTIDVFAWDAARGTLDRRQTITTLPAGFTGKSTTAEIVVHPSGRFLYGSNRGHDSIAVFIIDEASGTLTARGHTPTQGKEPRSFTLDPTGGYLLAANQHSDTVVTFQIDRTTGALTPTGNSAHVLTPVCLLFG